VVPARSGQSDWYFVSEICEDEWVFVCGRRNLEAWFRGMRGLWRLGLGGRSFRVVGVSFI